jgi:hypothetical protein
LPSTINETCLARSSWATCASSVNTRCTERLRLGPGVDLERLAKCLLEAVLGDQRELEVLT